MPPGLDPTLQQPPLVPGVPRSVPGAPELTLLEVGCGVGNAALPLLRANPALKAICLDFSATAIDLLRASEEFDPLRLRAEVCDLTAPGQLEQLVPAESVDWVSMIFVASAIVPAELPGVLGRLAARLRPGGCIFVRDYARNDLGQLRFKDGRRVEGDLYQCTDGTLRYYFSTEELAQLFGAAGLEPTENKYVERCIENRKSGVTMHRRWIQAKFRRPTGRLLDRARRAASQQETDRAVTEAFTKARSPPQQQKPQGTDDAGKLENEHVHQVYSAISSHFSRTRYKPWPRVAAFLEGLASGSVVLDVGCGNGKYLGVRPDLCMIGLERCPELAQICLERGFGQLAVADGLALPVRTGAADAVISIAVVHHHASRERREAAVRELARCLRPGGLALVYVWAREQSKRSFEQQDVFVPWTMQQPPPKPLSPEAKRAKAIAKKAAKKAAKQRKLDGKPEEEPAGAEDSPDDPAEGGGRVYRRYYHMFEEGELEELVVAVPELELIEAYFDHENWCAVARKRPG